MKSLLPDSCGVFPTILRPEATVFNMMLCFFHLCTHSSKGHKGSHEEETKGEGKGKGRGDGSELETCDHVPSHSCVNWFACYLVAIVLCLPREVGESVLDNAEIIQIHVSPKLH